MKDLRHRKKYIFVGGVPRSGTTLVQNLLDSHSNISGMPELHFLRDIIWLRNKFHQFIDIEILNLVCTHDEVDQYIRNFILSFFRPFSKESNHTYISEKSCFNALVFMELIELFPDAKFIHVVRDPRAVISSLFEVNRKAREKGQAVSDEHRDMQSAIEYYKKIFLCGYSASKKEPGKILTIVYEKLVKNPEKETKLMCEFLDLKWSKDMIFPSRCKHINEKGMISGYNAIYYDKKNFNRDPEVKDIDKWKKLLSSTEQVRISYAFGNVKELTEMGYEFSLTHLSLGEHFFGKVSVRLKLWIGRFIVIVMRVFRGCLRCINL